MARIQVAQITLKKEKIVASTAYYYMLKNNDTYPSASDPGWVTTEPTYIPGSTNYLFVKVTTTYSDNTAEDSAVSLSSSYEAAKDAYEAAAAAQSEIDTLSDYGLMHGHFWWNNTNKPATSTIPVYPIGAYAASGLPNNQFDTSNSNTYGINSWISSEGFKIRYNAINLASLGTSALKFYYPSTSTQGSQAISLGTEGLNTSLSFYDFSGHKTMGLTSSALTFYGPYQATEDETVEAGKQYFTRSGTDGNYTYTLVSNPTGNPSSLGYYERLGAATLNTNGLNIQEGTIQLGDIAFDQSGNVSGAGMYVNNNGELYIGDAEHYINLKNAGTSEAPDWKISLISDEIYFGNNQKVFNLLEDGLTGLSNQINGQQVYAYSTQPTSTRQVVYEGQTENVTIIEELVPLTITPEYELSIDTEVDENKTYYTYDNERDVYTKVNNPTGNPSTQSYYELDSTAYQRSFQIGFKDSGDNPVTSYNDTLEHFLQNYTPSSPTKLTTILTDDETDEVIAYPIYTYDVMEYRQSTDIEVDEDKTYYTRSGDEPNYTYTKVDTPTGNPSTLQYYELGIPWVCTEDYIVYGENYTPYCYTYEAYIKPKTIDGNTIINDSCEIVGSIDSDGYTQLFLAEQYIAAQETSIPTPKPAYYIYDQTDNTYTIVEDEDIPDNANPNELGWYKDNPNAAMFTNFTTETTDNIVYLEQTLVDYFNNSTQNLNDDNTVNFTVLNEYSAISQEKNEPYLTKNLIEMPDIINVTKTDASISYLSSLRIYMDSAKLSLQHGTEDIAYIVEETGNYNEAFDDYEDALNLKNLNIHNQIYFGNLIIQNDEGGLTIRRGGSDGSQT